MDGLELGDCLTQLQEIGYLLVDLVQSSHQERVDVSARCLSVIANPEDLTDAGKR
jgi:hypothetical protein